MKMALNIELSVGLLWSSCIAASSIAQSMSVGCAAVVMASVHDDDDGGMVSAAAAAALWVVTQCMDDVLSQRDRRTAGRLMTERAQRRHTTASRHPRYVQLHFTHPATVVPSSTPTDKNTFSFYSTVVNFSYSFVFGRVRRCESDISCIWTGSQ